MDNNVDRLLKALGIFIFAVGCYITLFDSMGDDLNRILLFITTIVIFFMVVNKASEIDNLGWSKDKSAFAIFSLFLAVPYTVATLLGWMIIYGIASVPLAVFSDSSIASIMAEHDIEERFGLTFYFANYVAWIAFLNSRG